MIWEHIFSICKTEIAYWALYPMDFKMHRDGKGANLREHR